MYKKSTECGKERIKNMKGGEGEFYLVHLAQSDVLGEAGTMFSVGTLGPGCSVGWHEHTHNAEICYFLHGSGIAVDGNSNGEVRRYKITEGDVQICQMGCGHAILNTGKEELVYVVLVFYPK